MRKWRLCCLSKATPRTPTEVLEPRLEAMLRPEKGPSVSDLVAQMSAFMERCNGTRELKKRPAPLGEPIGQNSAN